MININRRVYTEPLKHFTNKGVKYWIVIESEVCRVHIFPLCQTDCHYRCSFFLLFGKSPCSGKTGFVSLIFTFLEQVEHTFNKVFYPIKNNSHDFWIKLMVLLMLNDSQSAKPSIRKLIEFLHQFNDSQRVDRMHLLSIIIFLSSLTNYSSFRAIS